MAFHNDADYEAERTPEFLNNLSVFESYGELEKFLSTLPPAKGDRSFFTSLYGTVQGNEEMRFANACGWPRMEERKLEVPSTLNYFYFQYWKQKKNHTYFIYFVNGLIVFFFFLDKIEIFLCSFKLTMNTNSIHYCRVSARNGDSCFTKPKRTKSATSRLP